MSIYILVAFSAHPSHGDSAPVSQRDPHYGEENKKCFHRKEKLISFLCFYFFFLLQKEALENKWEAPREARYKMYSMIMLWKENKEIARDGHPGAAGGNSTSLGV